MSIIRKRIIICLITLIVMIGMIKIYYHSQLQQRKKEISIFMTAGHEQFKEGLIDAGKEYDLVLNFFEVSVEDSDEKIIKKITREDKYGVIGILLVYLERPNIYDDLTSISSKLLVAGDNSGKNNSIGYLQSDLTRIIIDNLKHDFIDVYYQDTSSDFDQMNKMMIESSLQIANIKFREVKINSFEDMSFHDPFIVFQEELINNELLKSSKVNGYLFGCFQVGLSLIEQNDKIKMIYCNEYLLGYQAITRLIDQTIKTGHYYFYLTKDNLYDNQYSDLLF